MNHDTYFCIILLAVACWLFLSYTKNESGN